MASQTGGFGLKRIRNTYLLNAELKPDPSDVSRMLDGPVEPRNGYQNEAHARRGRTKANTSGNEATRWVRERRVVNDF